MTVVRGSVSEFVSVDAFGADPTGAQDSTEAFQAAVNAVANPNGYGAVYIPMPSNYYKIVAGNIDVPDGVTIIMPPSRQSVQEGAGRLSPIRYEGVGGGSTYVFSAGDGSNIAFGCTFQGLNIDGGDVDTVLRTFAVRNSVEDCVIRNGRIGLNLGPVSAGWNGEHRILNNHFESQTSHGIAVTGGIVLDSLMFGNWVFNFGSTGIVFTSGSSTAGWRINNNHFYSGLDVGETWGINITSMNFQGQFDISNNLIGHGIKLQLNSSNTIPGRIMENSLVLSKDDASQPVVLIDAPAGISASVDIANNTIYAENDTGTAVGIQKTGSGTLIGRIYDNRIDGNTIDTDYDLPDTVGLFQNDPTNLRTSANTLTLKYRDTADEETFIRVIDFVPEGALTGNPGSVALFADGSLGRLYLKTSGTGNTGWTQIT